MLQLKRKIYLRRRENMLSDDMIDYIERNLFNDIDYDELGRSVYYNKFNAMRIFSASTDYTLAEYIRFRRLSEAGKQISETKKKIIDIAFDSGYSTAESFTKAFKKFNGFTPAECRKIKKYKYIPKWNGEMRGRIMSFEEIEFSNLKLIGFGKRFVGKTESRLNQDEEFVTSTRKKQEALRTLRKADDCDWWELLDNFDESGYTAHYAVIPEKMRNDYKALSEKTLCADYDYGFTEKEIKTIIKTFEKFTVNGKYAKFVSETMPFPMKMMDDFTKRVYNRIDDYKIIRDESRPELMKIHWCRRAEIDNRKLEIYIPVK